MNFFQDPRDSNLKRSIKIYTERVIIVVLIAIVSVIIPNFVDFLNLSGSIGSSILGFILPPIYYIQLYGRRNLSVFKLSLCIFIIAFGVFGGLWSTYTSIKDLIHPSS